MPISAHPLIQSTHKHQIQTLLQNPVRGSLAFDGRDEKDSRLSYMATGLWRQLAVGCKDLTPPEAEGAVACAFRQANICIAICDNCIKMWQSVEQYVSLGQGPDEDGDENDGDSDSKTM